jgi:hypothetical protein
VLPLAGAADHGGWIEREADVAHVCVVMPVNGEIMPFVIGIHKGADLFPHGGGCAESGAIHLTSAAAV